MKVVKGQHQLTSIMTLFSSKVPITIIIVEVGDGVAKISFGIEAKVVEVGSTWKCYSSM